MSDNLSEHPGATCDACAESPIIGTRFKCVQCDDFDLCSACHNIGYRWHKHRHRFWRIQIRPHLSSIINNKSLQTRHLSSICKGCNRDPIIGIRWKCEKCADYDLCSDCYHAGRHQILDHLFRCITVCDAEHHHGVFCGRCRKLPIIGTRWKCEQCADLDLCPSCHIIEPARHRQLHRFLRIQAQEHLAPIIANNTSARHDARCNVCSRCPILGIRWRCKQCADFNLCSDCYHAGEHDNLDHRFRCITATTATAPANNNISNDNSSDNGSSRSLEARLRQSHIADHDSDRIESTNSNDRNASQASIDTNLICVGSRVKIELAFETVLLLQQESGCDWSAVTLMDCMEHVGTVTQIKENGNVLVRYAHSGRQLPFNPVVLTRLADQSGPSENIVIPNLEKLSLDNDTLPSTESGRSHITNIDVNVHDLIVSAKNFEVAQYKEQLAETQQELEKVKDEITCPICMEARKNMIFQCGHGVCNGCNDRLQDTTCPICRKQIQQRIPLY